MKLEFVNLAFHFPLTFRIPLNNCARRVANRPLIPGIPNQFSGAPKCLV
jgi:hypothetical protein